MASMTVLNVFVVALSLIAVNRFTPSSDGALTGVSVSPLWDTSGNYSDYCSFYWDDDHVIFGGNPLYLCSLQLSAEFTASVHIQGNLTEDYLLYIEQNELLEDCPNKVAVIHGHHGTICSAFVPHRNARYNLQGNVSIRITEISATRFDNTKCPAIRETVTYENQTTPSCSVREFDSVKTCDDQGNPHCRLSFPPNCNSKLFYREVLFSCDDINDGDIRDDRNDGNILIVYPNPTTSLDITEDNLVEIEIGTFSDLNQLEKLDLGFNKLHRLFSGVFDGLESLKHLSLKHNSLSILDAGLFDDLNVLSVLDISENVLHTLPVGLFSKLGTLKELYLNENTLRALGVLTGLNKLEILDLTGNRLVTLPKGIFRDSPGLQQVLLSENKLDKLDANLFQNLTKLTRIYLINNRLQHLDGDIFKGLINLRALRLTGNQLVSFDVQMFQDLTSLSSLHLQQNKLNNLKAGFFANLKSIHAVNLFANDLTVLPPDLFKGLPHLDIINLKNNSLEYLPPNIFKGIIELKVLYLDDNNLKYLENSLLADSGNLTRFTINGNNLKHTDSDIFMNTAKLAHLEMSNNALETVPNLGGLKKLLFVDLRYNNFRSVTNQSFSRVQPGLHLFVSQHEICECYVPAGVNCSASSNRSPFLTCDRLLSDRVLVAMMWLIGLSALCGNAFVLCNKSKYNRNRVQTFLYSNLALSDLLMGVYMITIAIADIYFGGAFPMRAESWRTGIPCRIAGALAIISSESSVFFVTLISIDRFVSIKYPHSFFKLRRNSTKITVSFVWAMAVVLGIVPSSLAGRNPNFYDNSHVCIGLPLALYETYTETTFLQHQGGHGDVYVAISRWLPTGHEVGMYFSTVVFLGLNCVCYLLILICYGSIMRTVYVSSKRAGLNTEMKKQIRLTLKVAAIVITDFMCWFPIIVLGILVQAKVLTLPPSVFAWAVTFVMPINSAINPYLYTIADIIANRRKEFLERSKTHTSTQQQNNSHHSESTSRHVLENKNKTLGTTGKRAARNSNGSHVRTTLSVLPSDTGSISLPNVPDLGNRDSNV